VFRVLRGQSLGGSRRLGWKGGLLTHPLGLELGVSFEGFEEEMLNILKAIEDRRKTQSGQGGDRKKFLKLGGIKAVGSPKTSLAQSTMMVEHQKPGVRIRKGVYHCLNEAQTTLMECSLAK
jgi:hypothetical protein